MSSISNIILYSTGCPQCKTLETRLKAKNISYEVNTSVDEMLALGLKRAPTLKVEDKLLGFTDAIKWVSEQN